MQFAQSFPIAARSVGKDHPVYIIAEAGVAHFGSEEKALALVDLACEAGADAVKFQIFDVNALIAPHLTDWRERLGSRQLPYEAFARIQQYCHKRAITFFATAHDEPSLAFLATLDPPVYKVGSGEVGNWPFLRKIGLLGKPVLFSTGMYRLDQVGEALQTLWEANNRQVAVLHCVTSYPTPPSEVSLGNIALLRERFEVITGYSDHTTGFHFPLAAAALGAKIIEKHISLDFHVPNAQDWKVSCGPDDLGAFISQVREIEAGLGVRDRGPTANESANLTWAAKSLVTLRDCRAGETINESDLGSKRPGTGIPPAQLKEVCGRTLKKDLPCDTVIMWEHLL